MFKASNAMRLMFLMASIVTTVVIWAAHNFQLNWLYYTIPGLFLIVAITGICPTMGIARMITGERP